MSCRLLRAPAILALVVSLTACLESASTGPHFELRHSRAEAQWGRERPATYRFTMYRSCECLPEMTGPTIVVVSGGAVVSRHYERTGGAVPAQYAELFPAVEGLFAIIDAARARGASSIDVRYDATYGYPTRIAIDYSPEMADDEVVYTLSNFHTP